MPTPLTIKAGAWIDHRQDFVAESTLEHTFMNQLNTFYNAVLTSLRGADSVLIIGPGEAKGEFQKRLKSKKFPAHVVELEAADKMTDRQIADVVRQHFEKGSPGWFGASCKGV